MTTTSPESPKNKTLVVFDVEGIIIPKNRFLVFEMSRKTGFFSFIKIVFLGLLYEIGLLSLEYTLKKIFEMFKGVPENDVVELTKNIPLMLGTKEVFKKLNEKGYKTALISSGLPQEVVEDLAKTLHVDHAFGIKLEVKIINI